MTSPTKPVVLLMGQTPPPWHGQAVATQILFEHDWPEFEVHRLRMEFSEEMEEVGRFRFRKLRHLWNLIRKARKVLKENPGCILFYPPASAKWVPFLRDVIFLEAVRKLAGPTVFIYHASGLPVFVRRGWLRRWWARGAYSDVDVSLEVAQEAVPPHHVFAARSWRWCPCAIEVPEIERPERKTDSPLEVLFVGSLQEGKGILEILRTAAEIRRRNREQEFRFRIVGKWFSEDFERQARQLHDKLSLGELVEFVGELTGDEKWQAYASADVFFFPTHYASEATPIVLMEALGMGLPIVSTRWAGIPAMLEGCESSRLLPVRSPADYAAALIELADSRDILQGTAESSRDFYRRHFLPQRFIERVSTAFRESLAGGVKAVARGETAAGEPVRPLRVSVYLADQNPGHDRSYGISRMSETILGAMQAAGGVAIEVTTSTSSQQPGFPVARHHRVPWKTRSPLIRLLTDHLHPLTGAGRSKSTDVYYYPKGFLPLLGILRRPSVVTIHDTIVQYGSDHFPKWRRRSEYSYWRNVLKHTVRSADRILTVSHSAKGQIEAFMDRHGLEKKPITVTYEPCQYEVLPQPDDPVKENYVLHLASCEPHKRTADLVRWWSEAENNGRELPMLHLVGSLPPEVRLLLPRARTIVERPFLEEPALRAAYAGARALILPSEVEGFGLPALEAYYLGTPVCFVVDTSVAEILEVATSKGSFSLAEPKSLFSALDEVLSMSAEEVRTCGLKLREKFAVGKIAARMLEVFREAAEG